MKTVAIKIGGRAADDKNALSALADEMRSLAKSCRFLFFHGGGAEVTALSGKLGITAEFKDGVRMTTREEMELVDMVLTGSVNKRLSRFFQSHALKAVGISCADTGLLIGEAVEPGVNQTAHVVEVNTELVEVLLDSGFFPVISSPAVDASFHAVNINADQAALHVSAGLNADALVYLSDTPGVLNNESVIHSLTARDITSFIDQGVIHSGMVPKVMSAVKGLEMGISTVIIGRYQDYGDLQLLLSEKKGSSIVL